VDFSRDLKTDKAYLSKVLDEMQAKGIITKSVSVMDSRKYSIELTMSGKIMARNIQPLYNIINGKKGGNELWI
jgi:DNA-binding MarR family transcriptional regulator